MNPSPQETQVNVFQRPRRILQRVHRRWLYDDLGITVVFSICVSTHKYTNNLTDMSCAISGNAAVHTTLMVWNVNQRKNPKRVVCSFVHGTGQLDCFCSICIAQLLKLSVLTWWPFFAQSISISQRMILHIYINDQVWPWPGCNLGPTLSFAVCLNPAKWWPDAVLLVSVRVSIVVLDLFILLSVNNGCSWRPIVFKVTIEYIAKSNVQIIQIYIDVQPRWR